MNNSGYVAAETRRKIENIMEMYNYVPSALAVNLSRQETKVVGVVFPEIENTFYSDILHGITQVADELDLSLVLEEQSGEGEESVPRTSAAEGAGRDSRSFRGLSGDGAGKGTADTAQRVCGPDCNHRP
jgi:LacI family transcriptional regulator